MFQGPWRLVLRKVSETLKVYPKVKGIQVMNDEGKYMFPSYAGKWIPDSPTARQRIIDTLANWNPYSDSNPVEGIVEAINTFYEPGKRVSIYVFGDDFPTGQVEAVARYVERHQQGRREGQPADAHPRRGLSDADRRRAHGQCPALRQPDADAVRAQRRHLRGADDAELNLHCGERPRLDRCTHA